MSTPVTSSAFFTPATPIGPLTIAQERAASFYVASKARDTDDARLLLQALGLVDYEHDTQGTRSAYGVARSEASRRRR